MKYKRGDFIRTDDIGQTMCICADDDVAVFAPVIKNSSDCLRVMYVGLVVYSQQESIKSPQTITREELEIW